MEAKRFWVPSSVNYKSFLSGCYEQALFPNVLSSYFGWFFPKSHMKLLWILLNNHKGPYEGLISCLCVSLLSGTLFNRRPLDFHGLQALSWVTAKLYLGSCATPSKFLQVVNGGTRMSPELTIFLSHLRAISVFIVWINVLRIITLNILTF